jgi:hypothetical protein
MHLEAFIYIIHSLKEIPSDNEDLGKRILLGAPEAT